MQETIIKFNGCDIKIVPRDEVDISVMREIFKLREYRAAESVISSAQANILDVGGHAGFFVLYCRALNKKVKIISVEPVKENLVALTKNLKLNKTKDVEIISGVLSGESGTRYLEKSSDSHNSRLAPIGTDTSEPVVGLALRDLCEQYHIKQIDLIKMDVEGGEYEILESLSKEDFLLFKNLILEYHNYHGLEKSLLEQVLRENGFGVSVFPSKFDKNLGFIFASNKRI